MAKSFLGRTTRKLKKAAAEGYHTGSVSETAHGNWGSSMAGLPSEQRVPGTSPSVASGAGGREKHPAATAAARQPLPRAASGRGRPKCRPRTAPAGLASCLPASGWASRRLMAVLGDVSQQRLKPVDGYRGALPLF